MPKPKRKALVPLATVDLPKPMQPQSNHRASGVWSNEADQILIQARASGMNWGLIAQRHFRNDKDSKTPNACRKRHERLMDQRNAEDWDGVKLELLAQAYMDARREMWSVLADRLGEQWQIMEAKCMEKGLKNLTSIARIASKRAAGTDVEPSDYSGIYLGDAETALDHGQASSSVCNGLQIPSAQAYRSSYCTGLTIASLLSPSIPPQS